ncbi:MAG: GntR family transcriptional regulator [Caldilineaceae bacterium]
MLTYPSSNDLNDEDELQLSSLSQQAYQRIRDKIVMLHLAPGTLLQEATLIEELQLGRTPIREAIQRLANEGLITLRPRRGAFVADLSITDLQQIFELRRVIEGYAATLAAERATAADCAALRAALAQLSNSEADTTLHIEMDRQFHRALARSAHNKYLETTLSRMYNLNLRLWFLALAKIGPMRESIEELERVLDAIERHDGPAAERAIREHITGFQEKIRAIL